MLFETIDEIEEPITEDSHVLHLWTPFDVTLSEDYTYLPKGVLFNLLSFALSCVAYPILVIFNKLIFGFKITGKENLKQVHGAKITISNHIHPMDCTMNAIANAPCKTFFPTLKSNFGIPVVRHLIKLLHAIPIPEDFKNKTKFIQTIHHLLQSGKTVHFYPEGSLWPYYPNIRHFKNGAFTFAVENNVPIIPMVYTFIKPTGLYRFKKKPCIHLTILPAVYPNTILAKTTAIQELKEQVYTTMEELTQKDG